MRAGASFVTRQAAKLTIACAMTIQTITLGGKKFVILPEREFQRMNRTLGELAAKDRADIRLAKKRLRDPKEKPIPYERVRQELGLG
jgi:hypothetical protein